MITLEENEWVDIVTQDTYDLTQNDVNKIIRAKALIVDNFNNEATIYSDKTDVIQNVNDTPTGQVNIIAEKGHLQFEKLKADTSDIEDIDGISNINYFWYKRTSSTEDWVKIQGQTSDLLHLDASLTNHYIQLQLNVLDNFR